MSGAVLALWSLAIAVVASSVLAKVADWPATQAAWPVTSAAWRGLLGPWQVVSAEVLVIVFGILPVSTSARLLVLSAVYAAYAVAGVVLRGRPCACFGSTLATRFSWGHAAVCGAVAALLIGGTGVELSTSDMSVAAAVAAVAGVALMGWTHWHRQRVRRRATDPARLVLVDHIVVYGSTGCPGCRGVWAQREQLAALASCPVEFRLVAEKDAMAQAGGAIPAAIGYATDDSQVFGPVVGLRAIQAMFSGTTRDVAHR